MAIRKEDWPAINKAIAEAIEPLKPRGFAKAAFILRQFGPLATILGIFITLIVLAGTQYNAANIRLAKEATFEADTQHDIKDLKTSIAEIRGNLAKQSLINQSALTLPEFKATLPDLNSAITTAKQQNVKVSSTILNGLQQHLENSVDAPDFWPVAARFVSYRSQLAVSGFESLLISTLPNCVDRDPTPQTVVDVGQHYLRVTPSIYENCRFTLDSPQDDDKINWILLNRSSTGLKFRHCLIVYGGGTVNLILSLHSDSQTFTGDRTGAKFVGSVTTPTTLTFDDCLVQFNLTGKPPKDGQDVTRTLLASNGSSFQLTLKKDTQS